MVIVYNILIAILRYEPLRPTSYHNVYEELVFIPIKMENKNCAKCCECGVTVENTARDRLKAHRKVCARTSAKIIISTLNLMIAPDKPSTAKRKITDLKFSNLKNYDF